MKYRVWSKAWGMLESPRAILGATMITMTDVTRDGKPFQKHCMIPVHDVTMIVETED